MASRRTLVPIPNNTPVTAEHLNNLYHLINGSYDAKHPTGMPVKLIAFDGKSETGTVDSLSYALAVRHRNTAVDRTAAFYGAQGTGNGQLVAEVRQGRLRATKDAVVGTATSPVLVEGSTAGGILSGTYPNPDFAYAHYHTLHRYMIVAWYGDSTAIPFGWALCNGQVVALMAADGSPLTINGVVQYVQTPNMNGRFPIGAGGVGGYANGAVMEGSIANSTGKARMDALTAVQHTHTGAPHTHPHWHAHAHTHAHAMRDHQHSHTHVLNDHTHGFTSMGAHYHSHTHTSYTKNHGHGHSHSANHSHSGSTAAQTVNTEAQQLQSGNFIAAGNTAQHHHIHAVNLPSLSVSIPHTVFDTGSNDNGITTWHGGGDSASTTSNDGNVGATYTSNPTLGGATALSAQAGAQWVTAWAANNGLTDPTTPQVDGAQQVNDTTAATFSGQTGNNSVDVRPPFLAWYWIMKL